MDKSRRMILGAMGGLALSGAFAGAKLAAARESAPVDVAKQERFAQMGGDFSWKYQKLDPAESGMVAYDGYWHKGYGCGYGVYYGIVGMLAEKFGAPYNSFPFSIFEMFKGGMSDWGTICGALAGASAAIFTFFPRKQANPMVSELFRWYEKTAFPIFDPKDAAKGYKGPLPTSISNSVLCHISVSRWAYTTKLGANSKERSERCGRITADVCMKAIEILNAKFDAGTEWKGAYSKQESVVQCTTCHSKGQMSDTLKGNMGCDSCHSGSDAVKDKFHDHPNL
ncbi:MAG: C_GCAxxG_C_C family protein [Mailhella sp.]|nr:C_GCAxxG_C_C family protein [Mailhella sp.]